MSIDTEKVGGLYNDSPAFRKVLAGGMSMHQFATLHAHDFNKLKEIAKPDLEKLNLSGPLTEDGVVCAWITKLRFNQKMTDEQFYTHIQRADNLLKGDIKQWDLRNQNPDKNDNISLMWGLQALASTQGFDNGGIKVRFPAGVADKIHDSMTIAGAQSRSSTHASSTKMDKEGIGKDIANEQHRLYTPMGNGATLLHRTFKTNDNNNKKDPDLYFKIEDFGYRDSILHTVLHLMGPLKKLPFITYFTEKNFFHEKSDRAKSAEKDQGTFEKLSRKEHLSSLGKDTSESLIEILNAIKKDISANKPSAFDDFTTKLKIRIGTSVFKPFYREATLCGKDGMQIPMGAFVAALKENQDYIKHVCGENAFDKIKPLIAATNKGILSDRREGCEVLVDTSSGKAKLMDADGLFNEPKQKKPGSNTNQELSVKTSSNDPETSIAPAIKINESTQVMAKSMELSKENPKDNMTIKQIINIYDDEETKFLERKKNSLVEVLGFRVISAIKNDCEKGNDVISHDFALDLIKKIQDVITSPQNSDSLKKVDELVCKSQSVLSEKLTSELDKLKSNLSIKPIEVTTRSASTFEPPSQMSVRH